MYSRASLSPDRQKFLYWLRHRETMAKHNRRGKRRFNLRRVRVSPELALATLASDTVLATVLIGTSASTYRCMSVSLTWSLTDLTANDGPIIVGLAFSDYTVTEIKECLEAAEAIDIGDKIGQEKANRLVRIVGSMNEVRESLSEGRLIKTRLNWLIPIGKAINVFAYNTGTGALTTGAFLNCDGSMWVKDSA